MNRKVRKEPQLNERKPQRSLMQTLLIFKTLSTTLSLILPVKQRQRHVKACLCIMPPQANTVLKAKSHSLRGG